MKNSKANKGKILKIGLVILLVAAISGCHMLNSAASNSNQSTNSNVANKTLEMPKPDPTISPTEKKEVNKKTETLSESNKTPDTPPTGNLDDKINQANFDKIREGMSLEDVGKIFIDSGFKISDMTIHGKHSEMYMWSTQDFKKKIRVTFEKEKVVEKEKDGF